MCFQESQPLYMLRCDHLGIDLLANATYNHHIEKSIHSTLMKPVPAT